MRMKKSMQSFVLMGIFLMGSNLFAGVNGSSKVRVSMFHAFRIGKEITIAANLTNLEGREIIPNIELKIFEKEKLVIKQTMKLPKDSIAVDNNTTKQVKTTLNSLLSGDYNVEISVFDDNIKKIEYKDNFSI